jgi:hypothetical protein
MFITAAVVLVSHYLHTDARRMYDYWDQPGRLSGEPAQRLLGLMQEMFDKSNASSWLSCACFMLMQVCLLAQSTVHAVSLCADALLL